MATQQELLACVGELLPSIALNADSSDRAGELSEETFRNMSGAGIFATLAPKAYGGHEFNLETFSQISQKISAAHPSAGWVCSFLMGASWRLLSFEREGQQEIFGANNYVLGAGAAAPIFGVEKVDGGYLLSGRTGWNSGASHAQWFQIHGLLKSDAGPPKLMMFAIPRAEVTILDTWHIMGMQATASRDVEVGKVFVPEHRAAPFGAALEGKSAGHRLHDNPMYHIPFLPFAMLEVLPVVVGTHRGAANALSERIKSRIGTLSGTKAAEKVPAQIRMAQGLARAELAEQMLAAMVVTISASDAKLAAPIERARIKLHAATITNFCVDSVNEMARSVGGDAFRDEAPFQRFFRDINTVARHAFLDPDTAGESYSKLELGLPVSDPLI